MGVEASKELRKLLRLVRGDEAVVAVILFGSFARGRGVASSDVDVCLVLRKNVKNALQKRIDYSTISEKLDVQVFQLLPLYIQRRVLKEGEILDCKDKGLLYDIAIRAVREFESFKKHYDSYLRAMMHG
jgi:predicted nucleotidyltransferase